MRRVVGQGARRGVAYPRLLPPGLLPGVALPCRPRKAPSAQALAPLSVTVPISSPCGTSVSSLLPVTAQRGSVGVCVLALRLSYGQVLHGPVSVQPLTPFLMDLQTGFVLPSLPHMLAEVLKTSLIHLDFSFCLPLLVFIPLPFLQLSEERQNPPDFSFCFLRTLSQSHITNPLQFLSQ